MRDRVSGRLESCAGGQVWCERILQFEKRDSAGLLYERMVW